MSSLFCDTVSSNVTMADEEEYDDKEMEVSVCPIGKNGVYFYFHTHQATFDSDTVLSIILWLLQNNLRTILKKRSDMENHQIILL